MNGSNSFSVPSPLQSARNSTLYYYKANTHFPPLKRYTWNNSIDESVLSPIVSSALRVSMMYMARIGEILALKVKHICPPDRALSFGSKKSNGYMLYLPGLDEQVEEWLWRDQDTPLFPVSYIKIYRGCIKANILLNDGDGGNTMKAHAHRYLFAREILPSQGALGVKIALHHKSIKSQEPYVKSTTKGKGHRVEQASLDI